jgi:hypothetical protein
MFAVEIYAAVRRFVFVEGKSRREAARVFGLSRDTIAKMCRYSAPPGYVRSKAPERPKLGLLVPVIDAILESDKTAPPKQRHTAKRIFERLRLEHRGDRRNQTHAMARLSLGRWHVDSDAKASRLELHKGIAAPHLSMRGGQL